VIDTHCHLTFPEFEGKVPRTLADAAARGVTGVVTIATTTRDSLRALAVAEAHDRVWCSAGVHPLYSAAGPHVWADMAKAAASEKCVAWGELGLDNHYAEPTRGVQRAVLDEQLAFIEACAAGAAGKAIDKPIILHCREAFADLIPVLKATRLSPERMVFHCFTGTAAEMRMVLDYGACVSFTGVVTYKNAAAVREAVRLVPKGRFMVETDAPFLPPEPERKRPCTPAMVALTLASLAATRGEAVEALHEEVNETTARFFGIR
jgi:TatD DNase family protein